jgi:PAS domain S-box-containing protein
MSSLRSTGLAYEKGAVLLITAYVAFSAVWILTTDLLLSAFHVTTPAWQSVKGISYLVISGTILYILATKLLREASHLKQRVSRLALAAASAYESIVITELDGTISYVNPAFEKLTGYSQKEVLGKTPNILKSGKTPPEVYRLLWQTLKNGNIWRGQFHNRRKDGSEYFEEATISPVRDATGIIVNYLAVKIDVTRERELEQQLFQSQKLETVGQLASGIAHDLNNVLQVIQSSSELALRTPAITEYTRKKLNDILSTSRRGASIIGQLLTFSRRSTDRSYPVNINEVITDTGRMLRRLLRENIALEFRLAAGLPSVETDPVKISQVLLNLTVNARDAMPNGGLIVISTHLDDAPNTGLPSIVLDVKDTGLGIPDDVRPYIFDPFFTTKEAGKGSGLGLSTVRHLVLKSRGSIHVASELGQGTIFSVYYPIVQGTRESQHPTARERPSSPPEAFKLDTVVLCEDDDAVRAALCEYLQGLGYQVIPCDNSVQALLMAQQHHPGALITDIVMPGQDGIQLARQLRELNPMLNVVLMSGHTDAEILHRVGTCTDMRFLEKPFTSAALLECLQARTDLPN